MVLPWVYASLSGIQRGLWANRLCSPESASVAGYYHYSSIDSAILSLYLSGNTIGSFDNLFTLETKLYAQKKNNY